MSFTHREDFLVCGFTLFGTFDYDASTADAQALEKSILRFWFVAELFVYLFSYEYVLS